MHENIWRRLAAPVAAASLGLVVLSACDRAETRAQGDNTARNVRDRAEGAPTPLDQGESAGDRAITQHIRKVVTDNDALSLNAHNVKIITQDGVVTLRGPVETPDEKATVVAAAKGAPGVERVDDQLEVRARN